MEHLLSRSTQATLGYCLYNALGIALAPVSVLQLALRRQRGQETAASTWERFGAASRAPPKGPVIWFNALTLGESAVALPVIFRCLLEYNENVHILLTIGTPEAHGLLSSSLPRRVIVQYVPFENPVIVRRFLRQWRPVVGIFMESPAWPTIIELAHQEGVRLALLNARMSTPSFLTWFRRRLSRALLERVVSRFTLIVPQSDIDVGRFRMMGATLKQMPGWCSDLKYAAALGTSVWHLWRPSGERILGLKRALAGRPLWVAASTHEGEEAAVGRVHGELAREWGSLLTAVVPRQSSRCGEVKQMLEEELDLSVALWSEVCSQASSNGELSLAAASCLVVDVIADLPLLYSVSEIAFIGNSLVEGGGGHNLAEAAVAGCAVVVGEHAGHFNQMGDELNQAAVLAAEEAAAAVNSSGPLEDPFSYNQEPASQPPSLSPRDTHPGPHHWHGVLDEHPRAGSGAAAASRPSTAPAAVAGGHELRRTQSGASAAAAGAAPAGGGSGQGVQHAGNRGAGARPRAGYSQNGAHSPSDRHDDAPAHLQHTPGAPHTPSALYSPMYRNAEGPNSSQHALLREDSTGSPSAVHSVNGPDARVGQHATATSQLHEHHQQHVNGMASGPPTGPPPSEATNTPTGPWGGGSPASSIAGGPVADDEVEVGAHFAAPGFASSHPPLDEDADDSLALHQRHGRRHQHQQQQQQPQQHQHQHQHQHQQQRQHQQRPKPAVGARHSQRVGAGLDDGTYTPATPHPTPDDSAHAAGGCSPVAGAPGATNGPFLSQSAYFNRQLNGADTSCAANSLDWSSSDGSEGLSACLADFDSSVPHTPQWANGAVPGPGSAAAARAARTGSTGGCDDARPSSPLPPCDDELEGGGQPCRHRQQQRRRQQHRLHQQRHGAPQRQGEQQGAQQAGEDSGSEADEEEGVEARHYGHGSAMGRSPTMSELVRERGPSADAEAAASPNHSGEGQEGCAPAVDLFAGARLLGNGGDAGAVAIQRGGWEEWRRSSDGDGSSGMHGTAGSSSMHGSSGTAGVPAHTCRPEAASSTGDSAAAAAAGAAGRFGGAGAPLGSGACEECAASIANGSADTGTGPSGAGPAGHGAPKPRGGSAAVPLRRGSSTGRAAAEGADPSPLGDPGRATHYMDPMPAPSRLNLPSRALPLRREDSTSVTFDDGASSLLDYNGGATPSVYSPSHSATTNSDYTPSWAQATPMSLTDASGSGRNPWRTSHPFTPRLPRHDEHDATSFDATNATNSPCHADGRLTSSSGGAPPVTDAASSRDGLVGTSYMRYKGDYILPATHLPYAPHGPAVWRVNGENGLALAVATLLREPLERRSRGHAAAQAAAKLASGLVSTVWHVLDDMVIAPALQDMVQRQAEAEVAAAAASGRQ